MSPKDESDLRRLVKLEYKVREFRLSTCEGKERLPSFSAAEHRSKIIAHRFSERMAPYHCRLCGFWHVGGGVEKTPAQCRRDRRRIEL